MRRLVPCGFLLALLSSTQLAAQQQRPLATLDPETIGAGRALAQAGVGVASASVFPISGLRGTLFQLPVFGVAVGVGPSAEILIAGGPYDRLSISSRDAAPLGRLIKAAGTTTSDVDDITVGTKIRWTSGADGGVALGSLFLVRLPNSKHDSGLGQDTTDFSASLLAGRSVSKLRIAGNLGFTIMSEPLDATKQNDVFTYGLSVVCPSRFDVSIVGEVNGRLSTRPGAAPIGTESRGVAKVGVRQGRGPLRFDAAAGVGLTPASPSVIATVGVTYVFTGHVTSPARVGGQ